MSADQKSYVIELTEVFAPLVSVPTNHSISGDIIWERDIHHNSRKWFFCSKSPRPSPNIRISAIEPFLHFSLSSTNFFCAHFFESAIFWLKIELWGHHNIGCRVESWSARHFFKIKFNVFMISSTVCAVSKIIWTTWSTKRRISHAYPKIS